MLYTHQQVEARANEIYGLANQEQLSRLMEYFHLNGGYELVAVQNRGSYIFAAIRRGMDVPREYTNTQLRRQIVMFTLQNEACRIIYPRKEWVDKDLPAT